MAKIDYTSLTERVITNSLTEEDRKNILQIMKEYLALKEMEEKSIESNKETVFGKR